MILFAITLLLPSITTHTPSNPIQPYLNNSHLSTTYNHYVSKITFQIEPTTLKQPF